MKPILTACLLAIVAAAGVAAQQRGGGPSTPVSTPGPSAARFPKNADEFDQMFNQVKNWGRWGTDDQLGAANLITEAKRKQALALAKTGLAVSLAHNPLTEAAPDNGSPFEHTMNRGFSTDTYKVSYHGYAHSHIDALVPHPLQGSDLQRLRARRGQHGERLHQARHPQPEKRHRHARHPARYPAAEGAAVSRAWHAGVRRRSRGVGKEGGHQGLAGRCDFSSDRPLGATREAGAVERCARTQPVITRRSRRGSRHVASRSSAATMRRM